MFKILTILLLVLVASFSYLKADVTNSQQIEKRGKRQSKQNAIKNLKELVTYHSILTATEKKKFLSDRGLTEEAFKSLIAWSKLDWKTAGDHKLPKSNSTISLPKGFALLTGFEAESAPLIWGEPTSDFLEGYLCDICDFSNVITFENFKTGYVSLDDLSELDPQNLLSKITQDVEEANEERRKTGAQEKHVIGWIQEPIHIKQTNTIYWAMEGGSGINENNTVSVKAIRLGREGYEKISWIPLKSTYHSAKGHLDVILGAHRFDPGYRYSDFKEGDKVSECGITALVDTCARKDMRSTH
jgi:uncharacterized membrane-anchored protein